MKRLADLPRLAGYGRGNTMPAANFASPVCVYFLNPDGTYSPATQDSGDSLETLAYYTDVLARLTAIETATEAVLPPALAISTQTLNALGFSASIAVAGRTSVAVQLLWTAASTTQVVRLNGSLDGGTTWHLLDSSLAGQSFTTTDITDYATAGIQPGLRWRMDTPELTHIRLRWVSGTATNLALKWGTS